MSVVIESLMIRVYGKIDSKILVSNEISLILKGTILHIFQGMDAQVFVQAGETFCIY